MPDTLSTRRQLADWLRGKLGDDVTVYPYPTLPDDPADHVTAICLVIRQKVEPGPTIGAYLETHQVWVLDPHADREVSEDALDATLDATLAAINDPAEHWIAFIDAERDTFADEYPAYRLTVTIPSTTRTD